LKKTVSKLHFPVLSFDLSIDFVLFSLKKKMRSQTSADLKPTQGKVVSGKVVSPLTRSQEAQRQATKELRKMDTIIADDQTNGFIRNNRPGSVSVRETGKKNPQYIQ